MAYDEGYVGCSKIKVRMTKKSTAEKKTQLVDTTLGKIIFNNPIPQDLGFVDRTNPDNAFKLEVDSWSTRKRSVKS